MEWCDGHLSGGKAGGCEFGGAGSASEDAGDAVAHPEDVHREDCDERRGGYPWQGIGVGFKP